MELFVVNRPEEEILKNPEREDRIIENLKKSIEKKKKKRKENEKEKENAIKKQKLLEEAELENNSIEEQVETVVSEVIEDKVEQEIETEATIKQSSGDGFTILGKPTTAKIEDVQKMVLSHWLAYPKKICKDLSQTEDVDKSDYLSDQIKINLKRIKINSLFPVQSDVIPWILNNHKKPTPFLPRDICVSAPTGSGKTLAFAIPIIQILQTKFVRKIRALIVVPVIELARQVAKVFQELSLNTGLKCLLLSNSTNFEIEQELLVAAVNGKYYSKVDVIITTAGRLVQHINATKGFSLKSLQFLVIDEADRILVDIQNDWLYNLNEHVQEESTFIFGQALPLTVNELWSSKRLPPHKLLFSATLSHDPEKLHKLNLFQPILFTTHNETAILKTISNLSEYERRPKVESGEYSTPIELTEKYCVTVDNLRPLTVYELIRENNWKRFICFTNKADSAHRLTFVLQKLFDGELNIEEVSASNSKDSRKIVDRFKAGEFNGIICSDALARGIDAPNVEVVISYDPPRHITTYVHRIGRTARAGKPGTAITIVTAEQLENFNNILASGNKQEIEEIRVSSEMDEQNVLKYKHALLQLQKSLEEEHNKKRVQSESKKMSLMEKMQSKITNITKEAKK